MNAHAPTAAPAPNPNRIRLFIAGLLLPLLFGCSSPPKQKIRPAQISGVIRVACVGDDPVLDASGR